MAPCIFQGGSVLKVTNDIPSETDLTVVRAQ
jgi:hypothetical protein